MEEAKVQYLIDLGNTILACVQRQGEAERYIDTKLSEVEERWFNLVTQVCTCMWKEGGCGWVGGVYVEGGRVWMGRWVWEKGKCTCT